MPDQRREIQFKRPASHSCSRRFIIYSTRAGRTQEGVYDVGAEDWAPKSGFVQDGSEKAVTRVPTGYGAEILAVGQRIHIAPDEVTRLTKMFKPRFAVDQMKRRIGSKCLAYDVLIFFRFERAGGVHKLAADCDMVHCRSQ